VRGRRHLGALARAAAAGTAVATALAPATAVATGAGAGTGAPPRQDDPRVELTLIGQSPSVVPGASFTADLDVEGLPPGSVVRVAVHERVLSRTELDRTFNGEGLRAVVHEETSAAGLLSRGSPEELRATVDLGADAPAAAAVRTPGVYPVVVDALDADGERAGRLVTHLVLAPPPSQGAPPLGVAVLATVGAPPAPPGEPPLGARARSGANGLVDALLAVPDVVATLAPTPSTLAGLAASGAPEDATLLDGLRAVAVRVPTLALPYVAASPDALAAAGLDAELGRLLDRGTATQRDVLGIAPTQTAWPVGAGLGRSGIELLVDAGIRRVVVEPDELEPVADDDVLTAAGPFEVVPPQRRGRAQQRAALPVTLEGLATDERLSELLAATRTEPALTASRVLADLSMLWFERPGTARAVVLPVSRTVDGAAVQALLEGLRAPTLFRPLAVDEAFDTAEPLTDRSGRVLERPVVGAEPPQLAERVADAVTELRALAASVEAMVGPEGQALAELDAHVLRSLALGLNRVGRARELEGARGAVDRLAAAVNTPPRATVTLTAREGRVPLTITKEAEGPVDVRVHLSSPKLELPGGETFAMTLTEARTRLDIAVRTRASGSFPFRVEVTSPDGQVHLASTTYSVRSTAVSGVGVVLSAGAGLFLMIWWARHWRETRRSGKLVDER
jgi:hypothetical protein